MQTFRNSISCLLIAGLIAVFYSTAEAQDDLILWFPFEGSDLVAEDASGNGNNGNIFGAERVPGKYGKGIAISKKNQYVEISNVLQPATTIAFWFKPNWNGGDAETYRLFDANTSGIYFMIGKGKAVGDRDTTFGFYLEDASDADFQDWETPATNAIPSAGVWYHLTTTWDFNAGEAKFYIDGREVGSVAGLGSFPPLNANPKIGFNVGTGYMAAHNGADGIIDEFAIYAKALTAEEIQEVMKMGFAPGVALNPSPANEATDVPREVVLSWTPGEYAPLVNGHKVYLSENFNDVNDGIGGVAQDANNYTPDPRLDFSTTYYWRVDEVNGAPDYTVYPGDVWSFTTEPVGYAIENVTATASSAHQVDMGPENTINGSGLDANDLHSKEPTDMWLSSTEPLGAWIEFQFDNVYKLHEMWVWNSNQMVESILGFGFKGVTIEYSANGTDWTTLADVPEFAQAPSMPDYAHNTTIGLGGVGAKYVRLTANSSWGGIMPQFGLSEVRFFYIPVQAREPYPDSGAADVTPDVILGFRAGREAATHDVYFSTDEQAVIDGTAPVATMTETSYGPLSLDVGVTHYWKVNEINEAEIPSTWESNIWSFTTREFLVVDDFEAYNDLNPEDLESNRIFMVWIDGYGIATNGSIVGYDAPPFAEQTIVHSDKQSMPFFYNNTGGAAYSEAELTLIPPQDWTKHGVKTLSLWFFGDPNNTPGQMYVKVNGTKVAYDGSASNLALPSWQVWNIDLASVGTNLQSVTTVSIGIDGNGASGKLLFDDIGLYRLAPAPVNEWRIADDADDVEEAVATGSIDMTSSDLELPYENTGQGNLQIIGVRFTGIPIPKG
ncbi:MAG: LamG-like jellyroll fold domain-containing protein, partial [Planctomycetota bacterium]